MSLALNPAPRALASARFRSEKPTSSELVPSVTGSPDGDVRTVSNVVPEQSFFFVVP
jgi:hypothetical protein